MSLLRTSFSIPGHGLSAPLVLIAAGSISLVLAQPNPAVSERPAVPSVHGLDPSDMNPSAGACQDYYAFADGGWLKKNPIPPEYPSWGTFSELAERNRAAMRKILQRLAKEKSAIGSEERTVSCSGTPRP